MGLQSIGGLPRVMLTQFEGKFWSSPDSALFVYLQDGHKWWVIDID